VNGLEIHIVSLNGGNISSVINALELLGVQWKIADTPDELNHARNLILPGIGHFGSAMSYLNEKGFTEILRAKILEQKIPTLGICLGMQLLAQSGSEGNTAGLGIFDSSVLELKATDTFRYKIPHNGWNTLVIEKQCALLDGITERDEFFFLHKYIWKSKTGFEVFAETSYESSFPSVIGSGNCWGVQFHPEKSHEAGLQLIKNFVQHVCSDHA
jgi:glutamine amidotransferase